MLWVLFVVFFPFKSSSTVHQYTLQCYLLVYLVQVLNSLLCNFYIVQLKTWLYQSLLSHLLVWVKFYVSVGQGIHQGQEARGTHQQNRQPGCFCHPFEHLLIGLVLAHLIKPMWGSPICTCHNHLQLYLDWRGDASPSLVGVVG